MTTNGFSFRLAALVLASYTFAQLTVASAQECRNRYDTHQSYQFDNCIVTNFSAHFPVPPGTVSVTFNNVTIVDMDGCVRWLSKMNHLNILEFRGNERSFLDCLTRFNRSLPLTPSNVGANLYILNTFLPLDYWIEAMFKTLFGKTTYWDTIQFQQTRLVTRVPKASSDQGFVVVRELRVESTGVSAIREHDLDGYRFASYSGNDQRLLLTSNPICVVELAAFRYVHGRVRIYLYGSTVDRQGKIDWTQLVKKYPNATVVGTHPSCGDALNTACYQVIDTSYKDITVLKFVCGNHETTTKLPPSSASISTWPLTANTTKPPFIESNSTWPLAANTTKPPFIESNSTWPLTANTTKPPFIESNSTWPLAVNTTKLPLSTTSKGTTHGPYKTLFFKVVKFVKVTILGENEADMLNQAKGVFASDSDE